MLGKKNRPIPLAPLRSQPSTIYLNALKGRQNVPSARLSPPRLQQFGISRSIAVGGLILLGVPACHGSEWKFEILGQCGKKNQQPCINSFDWFLLV